MANPTRQGASTQKVDAKQHMQSWFTNHQLVAAETLLKLWRNPIANSLTWLVIAIALTLPGALWMTLDNLQQLGGSMQESGRITLYLTPKLEKAEGLALLKRVENLTSVVKAQYIDADQALAEFRRESGLEAALDLLQENPLPSLIWVDPPLGLSKTSTESLLAQLKTYPNVDSVQLDMAWVERLHTLLSLTKRVVFVLSLLLAIAIVLIVGNTIRLAIAARVDEIRVVKLVGGTDAWVRRPFLYTGLWYGLIGGLLSWVLLIVCWLVVRGPVANLAALYGSEFSLRPLSAGTAFSLLFGAMLLGWLGAWWSVWRHLKDIEPQ
ncbi:MAG: permease-like cell division protein FtsX [Venatoribacter sp.]